VHDRLAREPDGTTFAAIVVVAILPAIGHDRPAVGRPVARTTGFQQPRWAGSAGCCVLSPASARATCSPAAAVVWRKFDDGRRRIALR
jgi:hypothetical protein